ncbi:zygote defective protein 12-like [Malaya genurostris]|uniref:zygote defective protein 12-like n=1 Tax=Malaya genurostris TaxID=325434 RepID=UPI0026F37FDE|nr:zygote defective protein 12-like [Malaya genurostris]
MSTIDSKSFKTTKIITSRINSGVTNVTKSPSSISNNQNRNSDRTQKPTATLQRSRTTSRESTPTNWKRPGSTSSSLLCSTSKIGLPDDRLQKGIHKLGALPSYLRSARPATAHGSSKPTAVVNTRKNENCDSTQKFLVQENARYEKIRTDIGKKFRKYTKSREALNTADTTKSTEKEQLNVPMVDGELEQAVALVCAETDQIISADGPPCEGTVDVTQLRAALHHRETEIQELREKVRVLEGTCRSIESEHQKQHKLIKDLNCEINAKTSLVLERNTEIDKLKAYLNSLRSTAATISPEEKQYTDNKLVELRTALAQKSAELTESSDRITQLNMKLEKLQNKLEEMKNALDKETNFGIEVKAKLDEKESAFELALDEKKRLSQSNQEKKATIKTMKLQIFNMSREIADKDRQIGDLKASGAVEFPRSSLEASPETQQAKLVETFQLEVKNLRTELSVLQDAKRNDDVLLQVRSKLLESLESTKESFKARCEVLGKFEDVDEVTSRQQQTIERPEMLCDSVHDKQWHCREEEQIFSDIEQNNRKCKAVRSKILQMVKQLKKENRKMKEVISKGDTILLKENQTTPNDKQRQTQDQLLEQVRQLFPHEMAKEELSANDNVSEEEITCRIIYDNQIESESEPKMMNMLL